ncbi:hypothetical protein ACWGDT_00245 [Streptomyces avermitilis]
MAGPHQGPAAAQGAPRAATGLRTARLLLRPVTTDDLPAIERLRRDERIRRHPAGW